MTPNGNKECAPQTQQFIIKAQLMLGQHGVELQGSTYMQIFFSIVNTSTLSYVG